MMFLYGHISNTSEDMNHRVLNNAATVLLDATVNDDNSNNIFQIVCSDVLCTGLDAIVD